MFNPSVIVIKKMFFLLTFFKIYYRQKHCWVCFGTDDDEFEGSRDWVSPCKCRGSTRWVIYQSILFKNDVLFLLKCQILISYLA